jgi:excinuclease ABC subunit A
MAKKSRSNSSNRSFSTTDSVSSKIKNGLPQQGALPQKAVIRLRGACQHNLKSLNIDFPLRQLTVLCGVSGSGKSSLAFDTLYAEGQRRYIESFSAYTRQFLQRLDKPSFDLLEPLPPSIAVTRDARSRNNRSTVGTASEILEYLRNVFAKFAKLYCANCGCEVIAHTPNTILDSLGRHPQGRAMVGFEISWKTLDELSVLLADLQSTGFVRLVVNDSSLNLGSSDRGELADQFKSATHATVIVDRLTWSGKREERWLQSLLVCMDQAALHDHSLGIVLLESDAGTEQIDGKKFLRLAFSPVLRCVQCDSEYPVAEPSLFNFNHPLGACRECEGFGETIAIDPDKVVPNRELSLAEGAIAPWNTPSYSHELEELLALAPDVGIPTDIPVSKLTKAQWRLVEEGVPSHRFGGLKGFFAWLERKKYKMHVRVFLSRWRTYSMCKSCEGKRLNAESLSYKLADKTFADLCSLSIDQLVDVIADATSTRGSSAVQESDDGLTYESRFWLAAEEQAQYNASEPVRQVLSRLEYLQSVGLGYLSLDRPLHTLSSGESQRVNLTTLLGSNLVDMLYVFDEPTVGLHPSDVEKVAQAILKIRDRGNTVVLVEHEPAMMKLADRILEIGPGAGDFGGQVVFDGTPQSLMDSQSITGRYLRGESKRTSKRRSSSRDLKLFGATGRNLKGIDLEIPLGCLTVVTGPSGAGKSSLILDTLIPACLKESDREGSDPLPYRKVVGWQSLGGFRTLDQSPIPRSSRSTPATYCKAMDSIRDAFAATQEAKGRRMSAGHFSFNSESGRCPHCEGLGSVTVEMQFMADVSLPCPDCLGKRYKPEVLDVTVRDRNIHDVLQMSVAGASDFFRGEDEIRGRLQLLIDIGLGYLPLGQNLSTLSAGESMRLKLATILSETGRSKQGELIAMDEPTTGLHFVDIDRLLDCFDILLEKGHTLVVIEHNQQLIDAADVVLELGPGAGPTGGQLTKKSSRLK